MKGNRTWSPLHVKGLLVNSQRNIPRGLNWVEMGSGGGGIRTHEGYSPYTISSRAH